MGIEVELRLKTVETHLLRKHGGVRSLSVDELSILESYAEAIVDDIQGRWPVDTSQSRDAFEWTTTDRSAISIVIVNEMDYAEYVHEAGTPADPPLYETLIPQVWNQYKTDLSRDLRLAIDATEELIASERKRRGGLTQSQILAGRRPPKRRAA